MREWRKREKGLRKRGERRGKKGKEREKGWNEREKQRDRHTTGKVSFFPST